MHTTCITGHNITCYAGSNGTSGANGTPIPNSETITSQVYYSSTTISVESVDISAASLRYMPIKNIEMDLYSANGVLLAVAMTDATGQYHFDTSFTGMGYVEVKPPSTHKVAPRGTSPVRNRTSSFDPISGKSDLIQFLSGEPLNQHLDLVLSQIESGLIVKANSMSLNRTDTHSALWKTQIMPKSYHGGFTVSTFDVNKDTTSDYVLITKTGKPMAFIVDGRTGRSTKLSGQVVSNLRKGFVVQTANVQGDSTKELILAPSRERSGRISVIDLQAKKVLWNATDFVLGGMKIKQIGADQTGHSEFSSFQLVSLRQKDTFKILDGATGKVLETVSANTRRAEKRQAIIAVKMQSTSTTSVRSAIQPTSLSTVSIPRRRLPVMN